MSPLFFFFLCSHYMSFPLSIFNLLFFRFDHFSHCPIWFLSYSSLPPILFHFSHPFCYFFHLCLTLLPSHSTSPFLPSSSGHCHLSPVFSSSCFPPSLSFDLMYSAGCGRWRRVRYWTHWSTTMRQFFTCASPMAWWSPAPRTVQLPSGTWPLLLTSAYVVSLWDTGLLSTWSTLTTNTLCLPQGTAPSR